MPDPLTLSPTEAGRVGLYRALVERHIPLEERARSYRRAYEHFAEDPGMYTLQEGMSAAVPVSGAGLLVASLLPLGAKAFDPTGRFAASSAATAAHEMGRALHPNDPIKASLMAQTIVSERFADIKLPPEGAPAARIRGLIDEGPRSSKVLRKLFTRASGMETARAIDKNALLPMLDVARVNESVRKSVANLNLRKALPWILGTTILAGLRGAYKANSRLETEIHRSQEDIEEDLSRRDILSASRYGRAGLMPLIAPLILATTSGG